MVLDKNGSKRFIAMFLVTASLLVSSGCDNETMNPEPTVTEITTAAPEPTPTPQNQIEKILAPFQHNIIKVNINYDSVAKNIEQEVDFSVIAPEGYKLEYELNSSVGGNSGGGNGVVTLVIHFYNIEEVLAVGIYDDKKNEYVYDDFGIPTRLLLDEEPIFEEKTRQR